MGFSRFAAAMPYLALVGCFMIVAVVFTLLNGPLLIPILTRSGQNEYAKLIETYFISAWGSNFGPTSRTGLETFALVLSGIALGFVLNAFAQMLAFAVVGIGQWMADRLGWHVKLFVGGKGFLDEDYARFSGWIVRQKEQKIQWEWELLLLR